ncbi:MAG: barstar family protein [Alcaligenaceae bacterium]|jgi:RNAse (barnase) inhibitor barstar|nr:barstar family protein [Alcaligenaceae bacterium]
MVKQKATSLEQVFDVGGEIPGALATLDTVNQLALSNGLAFFKVDCDKARNTSAVLRAIAKAVDYPSFFGSDVEALLDCLNETNSDQKKGMVLWINQLHSADEALRDFSKQLNVILADATEFASSKGLRFIFYVEHVGPHEAPEPGKAPARYGEISED